jgi:NADH-quinone oxidoreductase subunit M
MFELNIVYNLPLISLLIFLPFFTAIFILFFVNLKNKNTNIVYVKYIAIFSSVLTFLSSLILLMYFDKTKSIYQFIENYNWISSIGLSFYVGIDGISLLLILLTTFLFLIAIISSVQTNNKFIKEFVVSFLILESLCIGLFSSLNLILFFFFFEAMLIPMFLIIGIWGSEKKIYAAFKFFLYTFFGSIFFLVAMIMIYNQGFGFDIEVLTQKLSGIDNSSQIICWICLMIACAVKIPMIPFHTWLPDAHVQAPTSGSVILAGILLKIGVYAILRIVIPFFPSISYEYSSVIMILSIIAIVYGSFIALAQTNMKRMIAYSSIAHMGYSSAGIFSMNILGISGAIFQMISHGLISSGLFLVIGVLYSRVHTKEISLYGGVAKQMPKLAFIFMIFILGSIGLPGTSGFVGELLSMIGITYYDHVYIIFAAFGVVIGTIYMLGLYKNVMLGSIINEKILQIKDINAVEYITILPLAVLIIIFGIYPNIILNYIETSIIGLLNHIEPYNG